MMIEMIRLDERQDRALAPAERARLVALYEGSFPEEERRASEQLFGEHQPEGLELYIIYEQEGKRMLGFVSLWAMQGFRFVEHFALFPELRSRGYGAEVLRWLQSLEAEPIVLECEHPGEEMARRRLGFYERCGFVVIDSDYQQAPYGEGLPWVPMLLLAYGKAPALEAIKKQIYLKVYGIASADN